LNNYSVKPEGGVKMVVYANPIDYNEQAASRVGYKKLEDLGDLNTQAKLEGYTDPKTGNPFATFQEKLALVGDILEEQRKEAALAGNARGERYFNNELQKWKQDYVELGSGVHHEQVTRSPEGNQFRSAGDAALESLKVGDPYVVGGPKYTGFGKNTDRVFGTLGTQEQYNRLGPNYMGKQGIIDVNYSPGIRRIQEAAVPKIQDVSVVETPPEEYSWDPSNKPVYNKILNPLGTPPEITPLTLTDAYNQSRTRAQLQGTKYDFKKSPYNLTWVNGSWSIFPANASPTAAYKRTDRRNPIKTAKQLEQAIFVPTKKQPPTKAQKFVVEELWGATKPKKLKITATKKKVITAGSVFEEMFGKQKTDKSTKGITKKPKRSKSIVEEMFGKRR
jgi:hypothetical protein